MQDEQIMKFKVLVNPTIHKMQKDTLIVTQKSLLMESNPTFRVDFSSVVSIEKKTNINLGSYILIKYLGEKGPELLSLMPSETFSSKQDEKAKTICELLKKMKGSEKVDTATLKKFEQIKEKDPYQIYKFWELKTIEEFESAIKNFSSGFLFLALLMFITSFILGLIGIIDAIFLAVLALLSRYFKNRPVAILLLLYSVFIFFFTALNFFGMNLGGGRNILLAGLFIYFAVGNVYSIFKYHELKKSK